MAAVRLEIAATSRRARAGVLHTPHGSVATPFFCAVGTAASVKALTPAQLKDLGAEVLLANTYHLYLRPGHETIRRLGGLHAAMRWPGPLVTDSGGYQVFSLGWGLAHGVGKQVSMFPDEPGTRPASSSESAGGQKPRLMKVDDDGVTFASHIDGSRHRLTPELSIQVQEALGADVILAFDEPTSPLHDERYTAEAMERTHRWALRCLDARERSDQALYGIVQGGAFPDLRLASARFIGGLPFDGVAIGGSLGTSKQDMRDVLDWALPVLPEAWPRHMLGIGEPEDLFDCVAAGIDQFDCVAPTRLARHGVLYTHRGKVSIRKPRFREDPAPIEDGCTCYACATGFSRGYLRHLLLARELLAYTLASIHNLHFVLRLMRSMREAILADSLPQLRDAFLADYRSGQVEPDELPTPG